jgi:hypothetical protein
VTRGVFISVWHCIVDILAPAVRAGVKQKIVSERYAMKTWGSGCIDPRFLDLGISPIRLIKFVYNLGSGVYPASNRNEFAETKMFVGSRARPVRRTDNLAAICEPIV